MRRVFLVVGSVAIVFSVLGCGSVKYGHVAAKTYAPLPETCSFQIHLEKPESGYEILGDVTFTCGMYGCKHTPDLDTYRSQVGPKVCAAGGDGIIVARDLGQYTGGTVIRSAKQ